MNELQKWIAKRDAAQNRLKALDAKKTALDEKLDEVTSGEKARALTTDEIQQSRDLGKEIATEEANVIFINERVAEETGKQSGGARIGGGYKAPADHEVQDGVSAKEARELQDFDIQKAFIHAASRANQDVPKGFVFDGLEKEMHEEQANFCRAANVELKGVGIPDVVLKQIRYSPLSALDSKFAKRDLTTTPTTAGGHTITTEYLGFLDSLRNAMVTSRLGATVLTGLTGDVRLAKGNATASATWEGETDAAAETNKTFTALTANAKRLAAYMDGSMQLMIQSNNDIRSLIFNDLVLAISEGLESAAINGSGVAPIPEGILNNANVSTVAIGTDGGALTWAKIVEMETAVANQNAMGGSLAYLTNSKVVGQLKTILKDSGSGKFLLENGDLNGYGMPAVTNFVPSNLAKGAGTNLSAMIFGNFRDLMYFQWGGLDIRYDYLTQAVNGLDRWIVNTFHDIKVRRDESFSILVDATTV